MSTPLLCMQTDHPARVTGTLWPPTLREGRRAPPSLSSRWRLQPRSYSVSRGREMPRLTFTNLPFPLRTSVTFPPVAILPVFCPNTALPVRPAVGKGPLGQPLHQATASCPIWHIPRPLPCLRATSFIAVIGSHSNSSLSYS